jgi:hypothetical protein
LEPVEGTSEWSDFFESVPVVPDKDGFAAVVDEALEADDDVLSPIVARL